MEFDKLSVLLKHCLIAALSLLAVLNFAAVQSHSATPAPVSLSAANLTAQADSPEEATTPAMLEDSMNRGFMDKATGQIQQMRRKEFEGYFTNKLPQKLVTNESFKVLLQDLALQTGKKAAAFYVFAFPDRLEVVVYSPGNEPIRHTIGNVKKSELLDFVKKYRNEIVAPARRITNSYLAPSQQLYQWLIAPFDAELQAQGIETLLFSMDEGLRSFPIAALHDGKQFLIEKYSIGLIPCISLVDTRYAKIQNERVLAMGASEFTDLDPLPAVSLEVDTITSSLWPGKAFLNQDFTLDNIKLQRQNTPYKIIHMATHAEFLSGEVKNSYIQLWDEKLRLNQIGQLRLNDPTVELLVLSACRTAVGDRSSELGFAGLAVQSGVKTVLASLWYVSDVGTLALMTEFYRNLRSAPIKAEALRQAQLAMLRKQVRVEGGQLLGSGSPLTLPPELAGNGNLNLSHPYFWSGFTAIGSPW